MLFLSPQYSRLLTGVALGFILGTVLIQSQQGDFQFLGKSELVPSVCGNGIKESGEECDDGNMIDGGPADYCMNYCTGYCAGSASYFCEDMTTPTLERPGSCCTLADDCDVNGGKCQLPVCGARISPCGNVTISCKDGTYTGEPDDPSTWVPSWQPTPTCSHGEGDYCLAMPNAAENGICHLKAFLECCSGLDCIPLDDDYSICVPKSSSSSSCTVPVGASWTMMCSGGKLVPCDGTNCMINTCPSGTVPYFDPEDFPGGTCPLSLEGSSQNGSCMCPSSSLSSSSSSFNYCCNTNTHKCYTSTSSLNSSPRAFCRKSGQACSLSIDCCSPFTCGSDWDGNGICLLPISPSSAPSSPSCLPLTADCTAIDVCCSGHCVSGKCGFLGID